MTWRPNRLGSFPAGRLTAAVTTAPGPRGAQHKPRSPDKPRPPSQTPAAHGRPSPLPPGCDSGDGLKKRPPARPAAGGSGRGRSPPPRRLAHLFLRLLLLLLPQPLPPQPPEASLPLQQAHLFRIAPRRGEEDPPLAGEGAWRQEGGPAHSGPPCGPVAGGLPAAFTRSDPRLGRRVPRPQLQVPPLGMPGEGRSGPPGPLAWALQSSPTVSVDAREGLWGKALGAEY